MKARAKDRTYLLKRGRVSKCEPQPPAIPSPGRYVLDEINELPHKEVPKELKEDYEKYDSLKCWGKTDVLAGRLR